MRMIRSWCWIIGATAGLTANVYGQGSVFFDTSAVGTSALVYDRDGSLVGSGPLGSGSAHTNFFAQLYAYAGSQTSSSTLLPAGNPVNFRRGSSAGYVQVAGTTTLGWVVAADVVITNGGVTLGGPVTVQLRVWWAGPTGREYVSYEAAVAALGMDPNMRLGASPLLYLPATGVPPAMPPYLNGLLGFYLSLTQPPLIYGQPQSLTVAQGANATFTVRATGTEPLFYQWRFDRTNIPGATSTNYTVVRAQATDAGSYSVVVTNLAGSRTSSNAILTVRAAPLILSITNPSQSTKQLFFLGAPQTQYVTLFATNLEASPWFDLSTNTADSNGLWTVTDATATNNQRFYRVRLR